MGKRKSSRMTKLLAKKEQPKLEVVFDCPFCDHKTVECTLDMKLSLGEAKCWTCQESYATRIGNLTEPIDVYSEWFDACENAKKLPDEGVEESSFPRRALCDKKLRIR